MTPDNDVLWWLSQSMHWNNHRDSYYYYCKRFDWRLLNGFMLKKKKTPAARTAGGCAAA